MSEATRDAKLVLKFDTLDAQRAAEDLERAGDRLKTKVDEVGDAATKAHRTAAEAASAIVERYGDGLAKPTGSSRGRAKQQRYDEFVERFEAEQGRLESEARQDAASRADSNRSAEFTSRIRGGLQDRGLIDARSDYQRRRDAEKEGPLDQVGAALSGGGINGLMSLAGRAVLPAAAMMVGQQALHFGTRFANVAQNDELTGTQKSNILMDEFIPGAKAVRDFADAVSGVTEGIRRAERRLEIETQVNQMRFAQQSQLLSMEAGVQSAQNRASVFGGASLPSVQLFDRTTYAGQIAHQEEQQRIGSRDAAAEAGREAEIARRDRDDARRRLAGVDRQLQGQSRNRGGWQQNENAILRGERELGGRNALGRAQAGTSLALSMQQERALLQQKMDLTRQVERASVAAAQAEARERMAVVQIMKDDLAIMAQREQRLTSMAERFGEMSFLERAMGEAAMNAVRQNGIQNVSRDVRDRARQFQPEEYRAISRQFGQTTGEFQREQARAPGVFGTQSITDLQGNMDSLSQRIRQETVDTQRDLARQTAEVLAGTLREIRDLFLEQLRGLRREIEEGRRRGNNRQGV